MHRPKLFYRIFHSIAACFWGYNLVWQLCAVALTYFLVTSGFDWYYFRVTRDPFLQHSLIPAIILGGILPLIVPLVLLFVGKRRKNRQTINTAWALGQAELLALGISSLYKAITGRIQPDLMHGTHGMDASLNFNFGFLRHGIFWGWPSSHTTVAFAMALTLTHLYPNMKTRSLFILYALYVGFGVSTNIHWFSDFAAGAIIGTVIGSVVGKSFSQQF